MSYCATSHQACHFRIRLRPGLLQRGQWCGVVKYQAHKRELSKSIALHHFVSIQVDSIDGVSDQTRRLSPALCRRRSCGADFFSRLRGTNFSTLVFFFFPFNNPSLSLAWRSDVCSADTAERNNIERRESQHWSRNQRAVPPWLVECLWKSRR